MKKLIVIALAAAVLLTSACAKTKPSAAEESAAPLDVSLVLPAYVVEGLEMKTDLAKNQEGLKSTPDNENENYKIEMSQSKYDAVLAECRTSVEETLLELKETDTFASIRDVVYNDAFTEVTLKVDKAQFESGADALSTVAVGVVASAYQYINGASEDQVRVDISVQDETNGSVLMTAVYPDSFHK